jgi:CDP-diacylglycerol--glycerol-3-phosphate 3-phosphatidyltransferase
MLMGIPDMNVPAWSVVMILAREFLVTGARALAAADGTVIAANKQGKTKTLLQMIYVCTFLFFAVVLQGLTEYPAALTVLPGGVEPYIRAIGFASQWSVIVVAVYTVYSGIVFARENWKVLGLDEVS